jgi:hypothetical protein
MISRSLPHPPGQGPFTFSPELWLLLGESRTRLVALVDGAQVAFFGPEVANQVSRHHRAASG